MTIVDATIIIDPQRPRDEETKSRNEELFKIASEATSSGQARAGTSLSDEQKFKVIKRRVKNKNPFDERVTLMESLPQIVFLVIIGLFLAYTVYDFDYVVSKIDAFVEWVQEKPG